VPAQPVDATPSRPLIWQPFTKYILLRKLHEILALKDELKEKIGAKRNLP
jgi:hypothetical protein